jgi:hypothetical protein
MALATLEDGTLAPGLRFPYWRSARGRRMTFSEVVGELDEMSARRAADLHADAIRAIAHAAAEARVARKHAEARRLAIAASRLCEELVGFWPRDSWEPIG